MTSTRNWRFGICRGVSLDKEDSCVILGLCILLELGPGEGDRGRVLTILTDIGAMELGKQVAVGRCSVAVTIDCSRSHDPADHVSFPASHSPLSLTLLPLGHFQL
jgi:hypothetical protein